MLHSSLCFLMGFFTGFTPSDWTTTASRAAATAHVFRALHAVGAINQTLLLLGQPSPAPPPLQQPQLLVVVTTTELSEAERRAAGLTRTAHALRLVSPPVVWLVVEPAREAPPTALLLRGTGVVYRHLTYKDNFSDAGEERHHQRNVALGHIEQHRLAGVVLFAGLGDVYDLRFFQQLREIRTFGAWPVATVSEYEEKVVVEGPVCSSGGSSSVVTGWFSRELTATGDVMGGTAAAAARSPTVRDMDVRGFAFSSSLLWHPDRWDRFPTSEPDTSQDSVKFVQRLVVEDYNKSRGMPNSDCSQIMVWRRV